MNRPIRNWMNQQVIVRASPEVRELVDVGRKHRWHFHAMGKAEIPTRPVFLRNWVLVPVEQDSSQIPARALERIQAIYEAGLRPKGFVIAHEAPRTLANPAQDEDSADGLRIDAEKLKRIVLDDVLPRLTAALRVGAPLVGKCVLVALQGTLWVLGGIGMLAAVVLIDPVLIAVTEDGYWVEIDRWEV